MRRRVSRADLLAFDRMMVAFAGFRTSMDSGATVGLIWFSNLTCMDAVTPTTEARTN
jgi:hypothetical protein